MAAERAGITKVFIPKENMLDLKDVAQEVKDKIEIVPVSKVNDILTETGVTSQIQGSLTPEPVLSLNV